MAMIIACVLYCGLATDHNTWEALPQIADVLSIYQCQGHLTHLELGYRYSILENIVC